MARRIRGNSDRIRGRRERIGGRATLLDLEVRGVDYGECPLAVPGTAANSLGEKIALTLQQEGWSRDTVIRHIRYCGVLALHDR